MKTIWKYFSDPRKNQRISVKITDGKISVLINDGSYGPYHCQEITSPGDYATKNKQQEVHNYIKSMKKIDKFNARR